MPKIFLYDNFKVFLEDYFAEQKQLDSKFSQRYFALKTGLRSTGFLSELLGGKRNLTPALIIKFTSVLKLTNKEADYFENLVRFNQAKTNDEKNHFYLKLLPFRETDIKIIEQDRYEYYSAWYHSAIRELLYFYRFNGDYRVLARMLSPSISPEQAQKAIACLERLGFIKKDKDGTYHQSSCELLTTGKDTKSMNILNFQNATIDLARQANDRFALQYRDISTITLTLSESSFVIAKKEIEELRRKLCQLAQQDEQVDRVYQFNCQLFPLSKW